MESVLLLSVGGLPPRSARGCIQELFPVNQGKFRRTVNGELVYLGPQTVLKYRSVVRCHDTSVLASEGLFPGQSLKIGCIQRLWQKASSQSVVLERMPVAGSVLAMGGDQKPIQITSGQDRTILLAKFDGGGFCELLSLASCAYCGFSVGNR